MSSLHYFSGPGAYNIVGMGSESMRKAYIESTRKGVFGTTSVRIKPITKKEEQEVPGPAHYQIKEKPFKTKYPNLSSTFASVTSRVVEPPPTVKVRTEFRCFVVFLFSILCPSLFYFCPFLLFC